MVARSARARREMASDQLDLTTAELRPDRLTWFPVATNPSWSAKPNFWLTLPRNCCGRWRLPVNAVAAGAGLLNESQVRLLTGCRAQAEASYDDHIDETLVGLDSIGELSAACHASVAGSQTRRGPLPGNTEHPRPTGPGPGRSGRSEPALQTRPRGRAVPLRPVRSRRRGASTVDRSARRETATVQAEPRTVGVMVVEDQRPFRDAARAVIERLRGFEVVAEADSGEERCRWRRLSPIWCSWTSTWVGYRRDRDHTALHRAVAGAGDPVIDLPAGGPGTVGPYLRRPGLSEQGRPRRAHHTAALGKRWRLHLPNSVTPLT